MKDSEQHHKGGERKVTKLEARYEIPLKEITLTDVMQAIHSMEKRLENKLGRMESTLINIEQRQKSDRSAA